jgi:Fe2+ or Zn2+ uptake regulation protein
MTATSARTSEDLHPAGPSAPGSTPGSNRGNAQEKMRDAVAARLNTVGQRLTTNRRALVDALTGAARPLTIPEILEDRPGLAQSSVYRNLVVLEEAGAVHRVLGTDDFARWELTEDLAGHHHHLICASCGRVEDVPASAGLERSVAAAAITRSTGFRTQHHRLDLVGVCESCS